MLSLVEVVHAGAAEGAVGDREAGGSMICASTPRQAQSRRIVPVFCGISGS